MTEVSRDEVLQLAQNIDAHIITQLIAAAVRFGIPDHLARGIHTEVQLSAATGIGVSELRRYLRALQGLGLVEFVREGEYRGTAVSGLLRRDTGNAYGQALMAGSEYYNTWSELDYALQSGESAFERRHGCTLWSYFGNHPEVAASFARTMRANSSYDLNEVLNLYQFPVAGVIADLGAGDGTLVAGLLERFPELRALVLEQPAVIGNARRTLHERGVLNRCTLIAGDFLTEIPEHADLYLLKSVIHNWNDENALRILRRCRDSMAKHSRVLVIERAMNDKSDDMLPTAVRDLTMLVLFGGRDRTAEAYGKLLREAGFAVDETRRGASGMCIIEGTR